MIEISQIAKQISKNTGLDKEVVEDVCRFPFLFTIEVMKDKGDYHDILFNKLFKFKLKRRFKDNKTKAYSPHE